MKTMKNLVLVSLLALCACGGKSNGTTTPSNNSGSMGSGATGGTTYGGASAGSAASGSAASGSAMPMMKGGGGDPCNG
ncbi:MAG TPA: hypothetical protein VGG74_17050 [Kofleriaceae bacterium]|jgi:hypothetical protein